MYRYSSDNKSELLTLFCKILLVYVFPLKCASQTMAKDVSGTAQYGLTGSQILKNLRRAAWLPTYDADGVNKVTEEIKDLYNKIHTTLLAAQGVETDQPQAYAISCSVIVHHNALLRFAFLNLFFRFEF